MTTNQFSCWKVSSGNHSSISSEKLGLPLLEPTIILGEKVRSWPFDKLAVLNSFCRGNALLIYPRGPSDTEFKIVPHLLHRIVHIIVLPRKGSKNYLIVLDMYILGAQMTDEKTSLPHLIIAHMMTYAGTNRHLPYAHLLTYFFDKVGVDLTTGGRSLDTRETIGDTTLHNIRYTYIHAERRWIREGDIPHGMQYGGYKDPHPSDPDEPFDEHDYIDYSFIPQHGDTEDYGVTHSNKEVHQEILAPHAPQPNPQPCPHDYIPQTFYGMVPPPDMPP
ncbi:hypothetical protein Scep_028219 [Stephania cephalantha]|uniref:Uncharacterized protein n=1 Tax=Stephania cephalantha TaxID=152367 RepID=A0AAP0ECQ1_9MAGN